MPALTPQLQTMTNIADAIREKDGTTAPIVARNFATRIRMIPEAAYGQDDRKFFRFDNVLTPADENAQKLIRCDGSAAFAGRSQEIYDLFKGDWDKYPAEMGSGLPARTYHMHHLVGNKLYIGSATAGTNIVIIDTVTGRVSQITGLPNRVYSVFQLVGTRLYCLGGTSATTVVCIDTTNDTFIEITLPGVARAYNMFALLGSRLFVGTGTTNATELPFINTAASPPTASSQTGLTNRAHNQLFVVGNKLYAASSSAVTTIIVITAAGAAPNYTGALTVTQITVPSRVYNAWFLATTFLYGGSSTAYTSIIRINTANDTFVEVGGTAATDPLPRTALPFRAYNVFHFTGTRLYVGSTSSGTSIISIQNSTGVFREVSGLPSRPYSVFQPIGTKIYVTGSNTVTTLVIINTDFDDFDEIVGLPSRIYHAWILIGAELYLLSNTAATTLVVVNTANDTFSQVTGLTSRTQTVGVVAHGRLYLGSNATTTTASTHIATIDLATKTHEQISGLPMSSARDVFQYLLGRDPSILLFINDKIYVLSSSRAVMSILVLTASVLPYHILPIYIKHGD